MERARTEWLRAAGYAQPALAAEAGIVFVVAKMSIDFVAPARFDEVLDVQSRITRIEGPRLAFAQSILDASGALKCHAEVDIVCVDSVSFRPRRIPNTIKAKLT
jgi:acyl-CoA thioester hydrolase